MKDYRLTDECEPFNIIEKKDKLRKKISDERPRVKNHYNFFSSDEEYKKLFFDAYNKRCAYCGVPIIFSGYNNFEMDHFNSAIKCQREGNELINIVSSCKICNRKKGDFVFKSNLNQMISKPDRKNYNIFYRTDDFYIRVKPKYENNTEIINFFEKLVLGYEFRRVDYILLKIKNMIRNTNSSEKKGALRDIYDELFEKRQSINLYSSNDNRDLSEEIEEAVQLVL